jgi:hypothetical protein
MFYTTVAIIKVEMAFLIANPHFLCTHFKVPVFFLQQIISGVQTLVWQVDSESTRKMGIALREAGKLIGIG